MNGFSYCGIHCSEYGVGYIPDPAARWDQSPDFEVLDFETEMRDGGVYYGNRVKKRAFSLACYFEDVTLNTREKIRAWLGRNTSGQLIFDERPFEYYIVRPSKVSTGKIYKRQSYNGEVVYSGTMTISFTAYQPFGYLMYKSYSDYDRENVTAYCPMLKSSQMPAAPTAISRSFQVYNCGTEICDTKINIAGAAPNGLTITNLSNETQCAQKSLPEYGGLFIDSFTGQILSRTGVDYSYHDEGFVRLSPCELYREVIATYENGSKNVTISGDTPTDKWVDAFIYMNDDWKRIVNVNGNVVELENNMSSTGTVSATVVTMNRITITGENISLTDFAFEYTPLLTL